MKGVVFNVVQEVVAATYGEDVWDSLLDSAGLDGAYTSLGSYPDDDFHRLVAAASSALEMPPNDVIRSLGRGALPLLAGRYPALFTPHDSTRTFLLTLNDIIHPEVRKLYPGADVPSFDFDSSDPDVLSIGYHSHRRLCSLAEGFIHGAADHFGERAVIEQPICIHRGDDHCVICCTFSEAEKS